MPDAYTIKVVILEGDHKRHEYESYEYGPFKSEELAQEAMEYIEEYGTTDFSNIEYDNGCYRNIEYSINLEYNYSGKYVKPKSFINNDAICEIMNECDEAEFNNSIDNPRLLNYIKKNISTRLYYLIELINYSSKIFKYYTYDDMISMAEEIIKNIDIRIDAEYYKEDTELEHIFISQLIAQYGFSKIFKSKVVCDFFIKSFDNFDDLHEELYKIIEDINNNSVYIYINSLSKKDKINEEPE